jgi:outer membrane lipoprotein carrier protein
MKYISLLFTAFILLQSVNAQKTPDETVNPKDDKAKEILEELSKKTKAYTSIKADFTYKLENKDAGVNETQSCSLILKGNKYKINIAGQEIVSNGKTLWTYIKDADEVQVDNAPDASKQSDNLMNPSNIFTIYEKGFKYKFEKEETLNGKTIQHINLYPEKANEKAYHTVKLVIDKNLKQINTIIVLSKDGNKYTYTINKFETNLPFSDTDFNFDVSKAGEVIDLR